MTKSCSSKILSVVVSTALIASPVVWASRPTVVSAAVMVEQIEADWLRQEELRCAASASFGDKITPEQDAIGACDGVKNGAWGFHTGQEDNPWWQIKRKSYDITEIVNRGLKLAESLRHLGVNIDKKVKTLHSLSERSKNLRRDTPDKFRRDLYLQARWVVRKMAFLNPLLNFDTILFVKRAPGTLSGQKE